jgi:hypothetical protein
VTVFQHAYANLQDAQAAYDRARHLNDRVRRRYHLWGRDPAEPGVTPCAKNSIRDAWLSRNSLARRSSSSR